MKLVAGARSRAGGVYLLALVLAAAGAWRAAALPSSIFPSVTFPIVKVIAEVGEEPAAQMMPTVTRPLEEAILRVPGIRLVRSTTSRGSTEISAQFAWGADMQAGLARVQAEGERVRPTLPPETRIDVEWMNTAVFPILGYALTSESRSGAELWDFAEYTLKPALVRIAGVSEVQIQGGLRREFQVQLDRQQLAGRKLSAVDVVAAIKKDDQVLSAGFTERNHELYLTLVDGRVGDLAALGNISVPLPRDAGPPAKLSELGRVTVADAVSYVRTTADGRPAVLVNIVRQPSASTVAIADDIARLLRDQPALIPSDVRWTSFYDQAAFVADSVAGVRDAILIGVALAALVLLVFLGSLRLTLVAALSIPLAVAIVALGLDALGQTINLMTLAGVAAALGLIADDAIVVIENIERHRADPRSAPAANAAPRDAVEEGLAEILPALAGSSLSTIVIFLPFSLLGGVVGAFFKPLALTMALALLVSFCLAAFVVPLTVALLERPPRRPRRPREVLARLVERPHALTRRLTRPITTAAGRGYRRTSAFFVAHGVAGTVALVVALVGGLLLYRGIGTDFLPHMDEGSIILDYWTPPGTSLTDTDEMLRHAEHEISAMPEVQAWSRRTGTQLGFFITEPNRGDYVIKLRPGGGRRPVDAIIDDLRARIAAVEPAIHCDFGQLLEDNIGDLSGGAPQPIDVKIFGSDPAQLEDKARRVAALVASVSGVEDVFEGIVVAGPALDVRIDSPTAARYGATTEDLHAAIEPAIVGTVAGQVRVGDRLYDLRVLARGDSSLADIAIRMPNEALLPLSTVATIVTGPPEIEIDRENLRSYVGVTARLSGRDLGSAIAEVRQKIEASLPLAPGMSIDYGGLYEQQQSSFRQLLLVLLAGLVLVGIVVLFEFGDWRAPLVTALVGLGALAGVFLLLRVTGMTLNVSSYVGAIMMVGIVGENAIFVIHEARLELRRGRPVDEAWRVASQRRLRPVAMTVLATALALLPLAFALGQGTQLVQPLAIAVIGGFALSGPLVLFVLPSLYRMLDPRGRLAGPKPPA